MAAGGWRATCLFDAAIARWSEAGLTDTQLDTLEAMSFGVADLAGLNLGSFAPGRVTLDSDAAGRGWYLDGTPLDDVEFRLRVDIEAAGADTLVTIDDDPAQTIRLVGIGNANTIMIDDFRLH